MSQFVGPKLRFVLIALAVAMLAVPATVAMSHEEDGEKKFNVSGEVRTRWEYLSNLTDALDADNGGDDDDYDAWPYRVRIAAEGMFAEDVMGHVEIQQAGVFGEDLFPLRTGQTPTGQFFFNTDQEVRLYQGFIQLNNVGDSPWSLKFGRQEHTFANQLHMGDADFYNGLVFDGVRATGDFDSWDLDLFGYVVEPGFFAPSPVVAFPDHETDFFGATADIPLADGDQAIRPYLLATRSRIVAGGGDYKLYTAGAQYGRAVHTDDDIEDNPFDWSLEAAMQAGELDPSGADLDFGGTIFEGWFGWNWLHGDSRSRVHVGALWASGDDDLGDNDIDAFFPLFGDTHDNNRLGNLDLFAGSTIPFLFPALDGELDGTFAISNVQDINAGYMLYANQGMHRLGASVHLLSFAEEDQFGLADDDLGTEIDLVYGYRYSSQLDFEVGASQLSPGDGLEDGIGGDADDIMRAWLQARLRWK